MICILKRKTDGELPDLGDKVSLPRFLHGRSLSVFCLCTIQDSCLPLPHCRSSRIFCQHAEPTSHEFSLHLAALLCPVPGGHLLVIKSFWCASTDRTCPGSNVKAPWPPRSRDHPVRDPVRQQPTGGCTRSYRCRWVIRHRDLAHWTVGGGTEPGVACPPFAYAGEEV